MDQALDPRLQVCVYHAQLAYRWYRNCWSHTCYMYDSESSEEVNTTPTHWSVTWGMVSWPTHTGHKQVPRMSGSTQNLEFNKTIANRTLVPQVSTLLHDFPYVHVLSSRSRVVNCFYQMFEILDCVVNLHLADSASINRLCGWARLIHWQQ